MDLSRYPSGKPMFVCHLCFMVGPLVELWHRQTHGFNYKTSLGIHMRSQWWCHLHLTVGPLVELWFKPSHGFKYWTSLSIQVGNQSWPTGGIMTNYGISKCEANCRYGTCSQLLVHKLLIAFPYNGSCLCD